MASARISPVEVIRNARTIAVVGASKNPEKAANAVPSFLKEKGYQIIPINPTADEVVGEKAYPSLSSIPEDVAIRIDVVDVFRPNDELPQVARDVVDLSKKYGKRFVFWSQLGLESDEAKRILDQTGLPYVMNACMKVEYGNASREG